MRLKTSQNALHFGMKCSKLRRLLGLRPRPRWGNLRRSPRPPSGLVDRGFLPSAIAASRLSACNFSESHVSKNSKISACPESTPPVPTAHRFFHLQYVPLLEIP